MSPFHRLVPVLATGISQRCKAMFDRAVESVGNTYTGPLDNLPLYGIGHSLGAKVQVCPDQILIGSDSLDEVTYYTCCDDDQVLSGYVSMSLINSANCLCVRICFQALITCEEAGVIGTGPERAGYDSICAT